MGTWSKNKVNPSNLNNGNEYANGDYLSVEALNGIVNSGLYSQDFVEHLADTPDVSEAMNVGTPSVELVNNVVGGKTYKKFKFKNLRYTAANAPVVQSTGQSTTNVMSQKATTDALDAAIEAAQSSPNTVLMSTKTTINTNATGTITLSSPVAVGDVLEIEWSTGGANQIGRYFEKITVDKIDGSSVFYISKTFVDIPRLTDYVRLEIHGIRGVITDSTHIYFSTGKYATYSQLGWDTYNQSFSIYKITKINI